MVTGRSATGQRIRERFLVELAKTGNVTQACEAARIRRSTVYELRSQDPEFAAAWEDALDRAADGLEQEAYRRAVLGWDEEVYTNAHGFVGYVHKFDSSLLQLMLKASRPEKYRDNIKISGGIEHSLVPSGPVRGLALQLMAALADHPEAQEALSIRLLASGE